MGRVVDPQEYPPDRRAVYLAAVEVFAAEGGDASPFSGSEVEPCGACRVRVALGPRQLGAKAALEGTGQRYVVACALCAGGLAQGMAPGEVQVRDLGNPERT